MKFLKSYTIDVQKIPKYLDFNQQFKLPIDVRLAKLLEEYDGPEIKHESKLEWSKVVSCIKDNYLSVKHSPRTGGVGRRYPDCPTETYSDGRKNHNHGKYYGSLCIMPRVIKNTIFSAAGWVDYDQVKGHPTILFELASRNGKNLNAYKKYLKEGAFDKIAQEIIDWHSVEGEEPITKKDVKWLFNKTIYGGGFKEWIKDLETGKRFDMSTGRESIRDVKPVRNTDKPHKFYVSFKKDTDSMIKIIYESNEDLTKLVCNTEAYKDIPDNLWKRKNRVMAYFCGIIEHELTFQAYKYAYKNGMCRQREVDWGFDGFTLPPMEEGFDYEYHDNAMNAFVHEATGFKNVRFIRKDYDDDSILTDVIKHYRDVCDEEMASMATNTTEIRTDADVADLVLERFPHWVYCQGCLYVFDETTRMWSTDKMVHIAVLQRTVRELVESKTRSLNNVQRAITQIASQSIDDSWLDRMSDTSLKKLLFNNGYYDGETGKFHTEPNPEIMFMARIPHDYEAPTDRTYMESIFKRFFADPLTPDVGRYYLEILSQGLMGEQMKKIVFGLGDSNTGKSTITKALQASVGNGYVGTFNAECFTLKQTSQDEAQVLRWALLHRYKRLLFSNELTNNAPLNGNMIKKVSSGGDEMVGRVHGGLETAFSPHFMCNVFANDITEIRPYDDAVKNRMNVVGYNKVFVENPIEGKNELKTDPNIATEFRDIKFQKAFVQLMVDAYQQFKTKGALHVPEGMLMSTKEWMSQESNVLDKFMETYEFTGNEADYVSASELKSWVKAAKLEISDTKMAREAKKYAEEHNHSLELKYKKIGGKSVRVWCGVRPCRDDEDLGAQC